MADDKTDKKKPKDLDELLKNIGAENYEDLNAAFKAYDDFSKKSKKNHLYNKILTPAYIDMHKTFVDKIGDEYDEMKVRDIIQDKDKKGKYRKATVEGLKKFFEKAMPSVLDAIKDVKDEEEIYRTLIGQYDIITNQKPGEGLAATLDNIENNPDITEDFTVGEIKNMIAEFGTVHKDKIYNKMLNQYIGKHFSTYQPHEVGAHLAKTIKRKGYEIKNYSRLLNKHSVHDYFPLRKGLKEGKFDKDTDLERDWGIVDKEPEETKEYVQKRA